jgi:competence protein ComFB
MKNLLESTIRSVFEELLVRNEEPFCGCERCQEDVMAFALNKIRPRYTTGGDLGVALANLDLRQDGARAMIAVTLIDGMRRVGSNPHRTVGGPA